MVAFPQINSRIKKPSSPPLFLIFERIYNLAIFRVLFLRGPIPTGYYICMDFLTFTKPSLPNLKGYKLSFYYNFFVVWIDLEALESVFLDVIKKRLKRRIAKRSGKGNQPLNIKTAVERPILKLRLPNFRWSFYFILLLVASLLFSRIL